MLNRNEERTTGSEAFIIFTFSIILGVLGLIISSTVGANSLPYIQIGHTGGYEAYGLFGISIGTTLGAILGAFVLSKGRILKWEGIVGGIVIFIIMAGAPTTASIVGPILGIFVFMIPSAFVIFFPGVRLKK